mmetsp:Transcript_64829/g.153261  ORF Transcript_64829/g.153261 Transcript_64829/m.153261 type:complete len:286 (-) Transcript_64829:173-1030(-)
MVLTWGVDLFFHFDLTQERSDAVGRPADFRGGKLHPDQVPAYVEYKARLRRLCTREDKGNALQHCESVTFVELKSRHGFGLAVREGLAYCRTEYVMVIQHDRAFVRPLCLGGVFKALRCPGVRVVTLLNSSLVNHQLTVKDRVALPVEYSWEAVCRKIHVEGCDDHLDQESTLQPLWYWFDTTHVTSRQHYTDFVLGGGSGASIKRGGFIEDKLGQLQLRQLREHGPPSHAQHGTFILIRSCADGTSDPDCPEAATVFTMHLDSGKFGNQAAHHRGVRESQEDEL